MLAPMRSALWRGLRSPGGVALLISALSLVTVHAASSAPDQNGPSTVPDKERMIYGCANASGDIRVLVPPPLPPASPPSTIPQCANGEVLLGWNIKGRPGENGQRGNDGTPGKNATLDSAALVLLQGTLQSMFAPQVTALQTALAALQAPAGGLNGVAEFTGNGQMPVPNNVRSVLVEAWGGGGGGSGATNATDINQPCIGGAGGGAGGYVRAVIPVPTRSSTAPVMLSVSVGGAGAAGSAAGKGGDGGPSRVSVGTGEELVRAEGGLGALPAAQTTAGGMAGLGGGGTAPKTTPIVRHGGPGSTGTTSSDGPPPVAIAAPPAVVPPVAAPTDTTSPLASVDRILRDLLILPPLTATGDQHPADRPAAPGAGSNAPQLPATAKTCGKGGAGGTPARGSLDPVGANGGPAANGGQGGDQTTSDSLPGAAGGNGYVLVLW